MAAPTSAVDIVNLALDRISEAPITSIDPPSNSQEVIMERHYDQVRRVVLREYVWNFAKKRDTIPRVGAPAFDFPDAYRLPQDFIRFLSIDGEDEILQELFYDIEGKDILLDNGGAASLKLRYIRDVTQVTQFDPLFINIFVLRLAKKIAYKFTKKRLLVDAISLELSQEEGKAISVDGQERPPIRIERSRALSARRGNITERDRRFHRPLGSR